MVSISAITGIARQSVRALLATPAESVAPKSDTQVHRAVRVLRGWHEDPAFTAADGAPLALALSSESCSFEALVRRYGGGVTYQSVLERLIAGNAVKVFREGNEGHNRVKAISRDLQPELASADSLDAVVAACSDAIDLFASTSSNPSESPRSLAVTIPASMAHVVRARLVKRRDAALRSIEEALTDAALTSAQIESMEAHGNAGLVDIRFGLVVSMRPRDGTAAHGENVAQTKG